MSWKHIAHERGDELLRMGDSLPDPNLVHCRGCNDTDWLSSNGPGLRIGHNGAAYAALCPACKLDRRTAREAQRMIDLKQQQANDEPPF